MIISANGIVINEYGDLLLVQRDDTRTLAPPGGACEIDEFPHHAVAREVHEETGLRVHPVRLAGLYFLPAQPEPFLFLCYRCMPRGGELSNSTETPYAGFYKANFLPRPMVSFHQEQVKRSFDHKGGPPYWGEHQIDLRLCAGLFLLNRLIYPWLGYRRARLGLPEYVPSPQWKARASMVLKDSEGKVLLFRSDSLDSWHLPMSNGSISEPPWVKVDQIIQETLSGAANLTDLSGIYLRQGRPEMEFVFTGTLNREFPSVTSKSALFETGSLPSSLNPDHQSMIVDSLDLSEQVTYKLLE